MRGLVIAVLAFLVAAAAPAAAQTSDRFSLASACQDEDQALTTRLGALNGEALIEKTYQARYALSPDCFTVLSLRLLSVTPSRADAADKLFSVYAAALIRSLLSDRLCTDDEEAADMNMDWSASVFLMPGGPLKLREDANRLRYAHAIRRALKDPGAYQGVKPRADCATQPRAATKKDIAEAKKAAAAIADRLPDLSSIGIHVTWRAVPELGLDVGREVTVSPSLPGSDYSRAILFRKAGKVVRMPSGDGMRIDRTNLYATPEGNIGFIEFGAAWAADVTAFGYIPRERMSDPDTWRYLGAFDLTDIVSTDDRHSAYAFIPLDEMAECIGAQSSSGREPAPTYRANVRREGCDRYERFAEMPAQKRVWAKDGAVKAASAASGAVYIGDPVFSPDGRRMFAQISGPQTGYSQLYDPIADRTILRLKDRPGKAQFSADSAKLFLLYEKRFDTLDAKTGATLSSAPFSEHSAIAEISADGGRLFTGGPDQKGKLWDGATGRLIASVDVTPFIARISDDGRRLITIPRDPGAVQLWDTADGHAIADLTSPTRIAAAEFLPDGDTVFATGMIYDDLTLLDFVKQGFVFLDDEPRPRLWNAKTGALIREIDGFLSAQSAPGARARELNNAGLSHDGRFLAAMTRTRETAIWNIATGAVVQTIPISGYAYSFSRDSRLLVVSTFTGDPSKAPKNHVLAKIVALRSGRILAELSGEEWGMNFQFSADGRYLFGVTTSGVARIYDLAGLPKR